jgi:hypothetical protein
MPTWVILLIILIVVMGPIQIALAAMVRKSGMPELKFALIAASALEAVLIIGIVVWGVMGS